MGSFTIEDLEAKCDSLYALVIAAARRAAQVAKPETRPLVPTASKKVTMIALEEIAQGKVIVQNGAGDEEDFGE